MARITSLSGMAGLGAALSMALTPISASAAEMPRGSLVQAQSSLGAVPFTVPGSFDSANETVEHHRGWRGYRGYRGHRHRHRGVRGGDVLAGVLILGGIAAVASAANRNKRDRDYRERDYRYRDRDSRDRNYDDRPQRGDSRYNGGRGIDNAVEMCVNRIERDVRVNTVDAVDRTGEGWRVAGSLYNGEGFTCRIGPDGQIFDVDFGSRASGEDYSDALAESRSGQPRAAEGQWSDDRYAAARRTTDTSRPAVQTIDADQVPAYPGGPLPGDEIADADATASDDDDRYRTAEAPDFTG